MAKAKKTASAKKENKDSIGEKIKKFFKETGQKIKELPLSGKVLLFLGFSLVFFAMLLQFDNDMIRLVSGTFIGILGLTIIVMTIAGVKLEEIDEPKKKKTIK